VDPALRKLALVVIAAANCSLKVSVEVAPAWHLTLRDGSLSRHPGTNGTFSAEITHLDGRVETAHGFTTKEAALDWVGERIIVEKDPPEPRRD
jgi:hypothetical protein